MSDTVTPQVVGNDRSWFAAVISEQPIKDALRSLAVASTLQDDINDLSVLTDSAPQIMLLTINIYEHPINEKCISLALVFILQWTSVFRSELVSQ